MNVIICNFSDGLYDMRRTDQSDPVMVLRALQKATRFSVFEATDKNTIARMMDRLYSKQLKRYKGKDYGGPMLKKDNSMGYPWTKVVLTDAALALLADYPERDAK